jgi:hypothetical protein
MYEPVTRKSGPGELHVAQAGGQADWQCCPEEGAACDRRGREGRGGGGGWRVLCQVIRNC